MQSGSVNLSHDKKKRRKKITSSSTRETRGIETTHVEVCVRKYVHENWIWPKILSPVPARATRMLIEFPGRARVFTALRWLNRKFYPKMKENGKVVTPCKISRNRLTIRTAYGAVISSTRPTSTYVCVRLVQKVESNTRFWTIWERWKRWDEWQVRSARQRRFRTRIIIEFNVQYTRTRRSEFSFFVFKNALMSWRSS